MKLLRMKKEYIEWVRTGVKTATTRTKDKGVGEFELISGSRYKPVKSGVRIFIHEVLAWTRSTITENQRRRILETENFTDWNAFIHILEKLNKKPIGINDVLYTHFFILKGLAKSKED